MKRMMLFFFLLLQGCGESTHKIHLERFQMNTFVQVVLYAEDEKQARQWASEALDIFSSLEDYYSIHKTNAFLYRMNEQGYGELSEEFLFLWEAGERFFVLSEGLFDFTVEPLVRLWGFYQDEEKHVPEENEIKRTLARVGFRAVKREGKTLFLRGRQIDLGGIVKGYALDKAKEFLKTKPIKGFLLNAGGNIVVGGKKPDMSLWTLAIRHPRKPNEVIALFSLREGSVATSGDYEQYFIQHGRRYHHIIDPKTGYPVSNGVISVTVVAPTGMESDALSTVMFLLGKERGTHLADRLGVGVCYIMEDLSLWTNRFFPALSGMP